MRAISTPWSTFRPTRLAGRSHMILNKISIKVRSLPTMQCTIRSIQKFLFWEASCGSRCGPVSHRDLSHIKMCPPILEQCFTQTILHPFLIGTPLLHPFLGLWTVYQRVLGFRPSYRTAVEFLYITIHVIWNLYALLHEWGTLFDGGQISTRHRGS